MKTQLKKTLFVVIPLVGLLATTQSACSHHHGRSSQYRGAPYGGFYGQTLPHESPYDTHHDERDRDYHGGHDYGHGY